MSTSDFSSEQESNQEAALSPSATGTEQRVKESLETLTPIRAHPGRTERVWAAVQRYVFARSPNSEPRSGRYDVADTDYLECLYPRPGAGPGDRRAH